MPNDDIILFPPVAPVCLMIITIITMKITHGRNCMRMYQNGVGCTDPEISAPLAARSSIRLASKYGMRQV